MFVWGGVVAQLPKAWQGAPTACWKGEVAGIAGLRRWSLNSPKRGKELLQLAGRERWQELLVFEGVMHLDCLDHI